MPKNFLLKFFAILIAFLQISILVACDEIQSPSDRELTESSRNRNSYSNAANGIPIVAQAPIENIFVKSFNFCYSSDGKFKGGTITIWRYNETISSEDFWTQGVIAVSPDGSVTFNVEHEKIVLLSQYSPRENRSLIPINEILEMIEDTDITINNNLSMSSLAEYYMLTHGNEEQIAYIAASASYVSYYDNFAEAQKPSELSDKNYVIDGKYYFILTSYNSESADAEDWTVFMFDR